MMEVQNLLQKQYQNYFFVDVQSRGFYPSYALKQLEEKGITIPFEENDEKNIKI
jgi:6-phospho-beta-glucosidase